MSRERGNSGTGAGYVRAAVILVLVLVAVVVMMLSSQSMSSLRSALPPLSRTMSFIDHIDSPFDNIHVVFFALLGCVWRLLARDARWWHILLPLGLLAAGTEVLQFLVHGRTPNILDTRDDLIGSGLGLLLGWCLSWLAHGGYRAMAHVRRFAVSPVRRFRARATDARTLPLQAGTQRVWHPRQWLIDVLRMDMACVMPVDADEQDAAMQAASDEGVVSLVHASMVQPEMAQRVPAALLERFTSSARICAVRSLLALEECRRISNALAAAGVPAIWLKGVALAQWLYPQMRLRDFVDIDLLVASHEDALRTGAAVESLGYALVNRDVAGDLVVHELLAISGRLNLELDLHWDISNKAIYANRLDWDEFLATAIELPALGTGARGLAPVHALLHAAVHRALNHVTGRGMRLRWLYDLHLLAERFSPREWQELLVLSRERGLAGVCHAALEATASTFATEIPPQVMRELADKARGEPFDCERLGSWNYMQWATLRVLPDWNTRARWLRQLLIPDMAHLRSRYGGDGAPASRIILRRLLDGVRRWRRY